MLRTAALAAVLVAATPALGARSGGALLAQASCGTGLLGDVTGDGAVNITDALQIARWSAGLEVNPTIASRMESHGDATGDGTTNIADAQQIARWSAGLSTTFPIGESLPACEGLGVTTTTTGEDVDPDGYEVLVDGSLEGGIGVNGVLDVSDATTGSHDVTLQGLAPNCSITNGDATRTVTVVGGDATFVDYEVECTATGADGILEVRNTTSGAGNPPGGSYTVRLNGDPSVSMEVARNTDESVENAVTFHELEVDTHAVTLGNLGTCTVDGGATKTVDVAPGLNILHLSVTCTSEEER